MTELRYFAPGKLVICGEYAVLAPGGEGLAAAVNAGVQARLRPAGAFRVSSPLLKGGPGAVAWDGQQITLSERVEPQEQRGFRFVQAMLEETLGWLTRDGRPVTPFELELTPRGDPLGAVAIGNRKLGLGSSASATVAAGAAVLALHGIDPESAEGRDLLFRLARIAHRRAQDGQGSGIDVAASVYGGVIWFRAGAGLPVVERVPWPEDLRILVGWSGASVETGPRAQQIDVFRETSPAWFSQFVSTSRAWTRSIVEALQTGERAAVLRGLAMHRRLLLELGERAGLTMETPAMEALARAGARFGVAKQSGAGGGDCGLMVLRAPVFLQPAALALRECGLHQLALVVPWGGVEAMTRPSSWRRDQD